MGLVQYDDSRHCCGNGRLYRPLEKQSLMSDVLAHAALPGVVIAYMLIEEKHLPILIFGAVISTMIGAFLIQMIRSMTRISDDTSMGMILSVFFASGIMLLTIINRSAGGNQSGLDTFIFGQAAVMVHSDVVTMLILATIVLVIVAACFKEWKLYLFDPGFTKGIGMPMKFMSGLYTTLLVLTVVVGIQAVGVILIAALMIIPSVSAGYWAKSFQSMVMISAVIGGISGMAGTLISAGQRFTDRTIHFVIAAIIFLSLYFSAKRGNYFEIYTI